MDIPFKLSFKQNYETKINYFVNDERELYSIPENLISSVIENKKLDLVFMSNDPNDRLFFDLLDIVIINNMNTEEIPFLSPSNDPITIYDTNNYTGALIPGYYKIKVTTKAESFFTWLKILPKQITEEEWVILRDEVEEELNGLARDILYQRSGFNTNLESNLPINLLLKINSVLNTKSKWQTSINSIKNNPSFKINKEYKIVSKSKAKFIDSTSLKMDKIHQKSEEHIHTRLNIISYETIENKKIVFTIKSIIKELNEIITSLDKWILFSKSNNNMTGKYNKLNGTSLLDQSFIDALSELEEKRKQLKHILNDCKQFLDSQWVSSMKHENLRYNAFYSPIQKPDYRNIMKLYNILKTENYTYELNSNYAYYWKRTDQLYEIWGVLQLIKSLSSEIVGYKITGGWIYDYNKSIRKTYEVPFLEKGTSIEFVNDDIQINLIYDEAISNHENKSLLFTKMRNNRPDVRLDFFKSEEYIGSIIIDFKYRPLYYIWNSQGDKTDVMQQLTSYKDGISSLHILSRTYPGMAHRLKPVNEVWAVYPAHINNKLTKKPSHINLVELTPGYNKEELSNLLKKSIEKLLLDLNKQ